MAVAMIVKDLKTDSFYISTTNGASNIPFNSKKQYLIQKWDNFYTIASGRGYLIQRIFATLDLNSLPTPLTKEVLYNNFYLDFINILKEEHVVKKEDGAIESFSEDILFIQDGRAFDVFDEGINEINTFGGVGRDNALAYELGELHFYTMDAKKLAVLMIEKTIPKSINVKYPILVANSRSDMMEIIYEDGTIKTEQLTCQWRKHDAKHASH